MTHTKKPACVLEIGQSHSGKTVRKKVDASKSIIRDQTSYVLCNDPVCLDEVQRVVGDQNHTHSHRHTPIHTHTQTNNSFWSMYTFMRQAKTNGVVIYPTAVHASCDIGLECPTALYLFGVFTSLLTLYRSYHDG